MIDTLVTNIDRLELSLVPKPWPFAIERRAAIDAFFEKLQRDKPAVWNGRVLLMHRQVVADGVLRGEYMEIDYASFAAWRHWGRPAAGVHDCFGAAAVATSDGAFLVGVMGPHTANSGQIYFPCGTPEPRDLVGKKVDLDLSIQRELEEETGLEAASFTAEPGWTMVADGVLIALIKVLRSRESAAALRERVIAHLASEAHPELSGVRMVGKVADLDPAMPRFVTAFMASRLGHG
ncbi:MAG TPA: NUDIX hydrolase [Pseudolabrys sp.]|nr:NUDIX hydrolase [Pseudolabrys sp.]